jgi:hypothetical protein
MEANAEFARINALPEWKDFRLPAYVRIRGGRLAARGNRTRGAAEAAIEEEEELTLDELLKVS